jgi:hypothetical protein
MSGDSWDDLLAEARQALADQKDVNSELGDDMSPQPEQHFAGRWRGSGVMVTKERGTVGVYLVWDRDGKPGFLYQHAGLIAEVDAEQPQLGDEVLVLRGETREFEKDGETRRSFPYVLRRRPSSEPLPEADPVELLEGGDKPDDDIPF